MSNALYVIAAFAYLGANWLVLKIAISEWQSGNRWIVNVNLLAKPIQARRFLGFGILLLIAFLSTIAASKLSHLSI
jgi:hypothetical protein